MGQPLTGGASAGIVFVNPRSGSADDGSLADAFDSSEVVACDPAKVAECVDAARADGRPWVGIAGGDGTLRAGAGRLLDGTTPLLVVPAGTRNHFARQLGIETVDDAAGLTTGAEQRQVDVGDVNGCTFLNNSSIGLYPMVVLRREAHERRMPKQLAQLVAVWEQVRHGHRFTVSIDGARIRVWMVFVGNGRYGDGLLNLTTRESLDDTCLDVRVVRADRPLARTRVVAAVLLGRLSRSPLLDRRTCDTVTIDVDRATVDVALDGEVETLTPPLVYRVRPKALRVLVPPPPDDADS